MPHCSFLLMTCFDLDWFGFTPCFFFFFFAAYSGLPSNLYTLLLSSYIFSISLCLEAISLQGINPRKALIIRVKMRRSKSHIAQ